MKFLPKTFNDLIALILIIGIMAIWILEGKGLVMPVEVNGALIVTWTLVIQFYFRKKVTEGG